MLRATLALSLLGAAGLATTWETVDVTCPVCTNRFKADEWHSTNDMGGIDRDFCRHAAGGTVLMMRCWTCPRCKYTGESSDFSGDEIPRELVARLQKKNPLTTPVKIDPKLEHTGGIPAWARYDLLHQVRVIQGGVSEESLGWIRLRSAWTLRFREVPKTCEAALQAGAKKLEPELRKDGAYAGTMKLARLLEKGAVPQQRHAAAWLYRSRGESPDAQRVLATLPQEIAGPLLADDAVERRYFSLAIVHFEKAVASGKVENVFGVRYLVGELLRKTGREKAALELLGKLRRDDLPDWLATWTDEAIARMKR